jgi:hypothetical protein
MVGNFFLPLRDAPLHMLDLTLLVLRNHTQTLMVDLTLATRTPMGTMAMLIFILRLRLDMFMV